MPDVKTEPIDSELPVVYEESEAEDAPHFTHPDDMHRFLAKPSGNMVRIRCSAKGKSY